MRHLLKLSSIAPLSACRRRRQGRRQRKTKEGTYKGTYAANGTFKATPIGKDRALSSLTNTAWV